MPAQNLYWIDDSPHDMYLMMEHIFPDLWNIDCSCKIILFGNDYCSKETENGPDENDQKAFETDLNRFFSVYCQEIDNRNWEELGKTYQKKKYLLSSPSVFLFPLEGDREILARHWLDRDLLKDVEEHPENLFSASVNSGCAEPEALDAAKEESDAEQRGCLSVDQLIKDMNIPEDAAVALDICLLYHDMDRIEAGLPSISMALYDRLLKQHHRCYLYSSRTVARTVMAQWVQTFKKLFKEAADEAGSIIIHHKRGLWVGTSNTDAKKALVDLFQRKD